MSLMDLIYPRRCHGCGGVVGRESRYFCWDCLAGIAYVESPFCSRCGDPVPGRIDHDYICYQCSRIRVYFDLARSAVRYEGFVGDALRDLKYNGAVWLSPDLGRLLHAAAVTHYNLLEIDALCYVPMSSKHQRERGYNQAQLLAVALSRIMRKPVRGLGLRRLFMTESQTGLNAAKRMNNVKGAFSSRYERGSSTIMGRHGLCEGLNILLIDDVMTTGATVNECARVLKRAGANCVYVLTVARG